MNDRSYETPAVTVIGPVTELTAGSTTGDPDQVDGAGSTIPDDATGAAR